MFNGRKAGERFDTSQAQTRKIRQFYFATATNIAQRVAALVAIVTGIRHGANAYTIENNPDDAIKVMQGNSFLFLAGGVAGWFAGREFIF